MYAFVDRPVSELSHEGQLLIWAMRSWVVSVGKKACPGTGIGKVFAGRNMIAALQPFLRMMALFNRGGLENFEFCQLACNHVSEHEAIFLQLVSDARSNEALIVRHTLSILVEEEFVGDLFEAIVTLSGALGRASEAPYLNC